MYAVFRETTYDPENPVEQSPEFREFQKLHAEQKGYKGTVVTDVGDGRYLTLTLWETAEDMHAARKTLGPVVERLLNPLMTTPSTLLGTGKVIESDLWQS